MILVNTEEIFGYETIEVLGLVRGSSTRSRSVISDFTAGIKNLVGGEVHEYTKLLADTREQALQRLKDDAQKLGANAIINIRFSSSTIAQGSSEILVYGTAVKIIKK